MASVWADALSAPAADKPLYRLRRRNAELISESISSGAESRLSQISRGMSTILKGTNVSPLGRFTTYADEVSRGLAEKPPIKPRLPRLARNVAIGGIPTAAVMGGIGFMEGEQGLEDVFKGLDMEYDDPTTFGTSSEWDTAFGGNPLIGPDYFLNNPLGLGVK